MQRDVALNALKAADKLKIDTNFGMNQFDGPFVRYDSFW